MEFINRKSELKILKEAKDLSHKKLYTVLIYGLRRVGKTSLIFQFMKARDIYFFVNKDKTSESLLIEYQDILKNKNILGALESIKSWEEFFKVLFERYKGVIAFDEFQNFMYVDKSVFGTLQKHIDMNESKKDLLFIFSGSTTGLIKKIFSDSKQPLFGRVKRLLQLEQLKFLDTVEMCKKLNIDDLSDIITLYSIFGGFPRYYVAIEDENLNGKPADEILEKFFFVRNSVFEDEVNTILSLEFGRRSGVYYDILTAIANGSTRISEIASFLRKKETALTRQINELVNYFNLACIETQVIGNKKALFIKHPLMNFWFKFIYKKLSEYKMKDVLLIGKIKKESKNIGREFENVCSELLVELNNSKKLPFQFEKIGRQWGKFRGEKGKNAYEIDLVALSEQTKEILFCECKWQDKVDAKKILSELKKKSKFVQWNNEGRKEHYAVFAKSFKRKFREPNVMLFDLKDFGRMFKP